MQNDSYTSIFGVSLLDDLHNYFPDILYRHQRFTSVQDLLQYIQEQTRTRFNLLEVGRRQYISAHPSTSNIAPSHSPLTSNITYSPMNPRSSDTAYTINNRAVDISGNPATYTTPVRPIPVTINNQIPVRSSRRQTLFYDFPSIYAEETPTMHLMTNLLNLIQQPTAFQDVVVYPTNQQIDAATTVQTVSATLEDPCAICQEDMEAGAQTRRITRCQHSFHLQCIGSWFEQSCMCPICRTDIRGGHQP
jgi:hypothetical protein